MKGKKNLYKLKYIHEYYHNHIHTPTLTLTTHIIKSKFLLAKSNPNIKYKLQSIIYEREKKTQYTVYIITQNKTKQMKKKSFIGR